MNLRFGHSCETERVCFSSGPKDPHRPLGLCGQALGAARQRAEQPEQPEQPGSPLRRVQKNSFCVSRVWESSPDVKSRGQIDV